MSFAEKALRQRVQPQGGVRPLVQRPRAERFNREFQLLGHFRYLRLGNHRETKWLHQFIDTLHGNAAHRALDDGLDPTALGLPPRFKQPCGKGATAQSLGTAIGSIFK